MSDTSVISNLALIGRLDLLRSQFEWVAVPDAVRDELARIPNSEAAVLIRDAYDARWLAWRTLLDRRWAALLATVVDAGEAEAIALAAEIGADVVLMDEKDGRALARQAGLNVRGVLGVLVRAKTMGQIAFVKPEIEALRSRARFFVAAALEDEVLRSVGES